MLLDDKQICCKDTDFDEKHTKHTFFPGEKTPPLLLSSSTRVIAFLAASLIATDPRLDAEREKSYDIAKDIAPETNRIH